MSHNDFQPDIGCSGFMISYAVARVIIIFASEAPSHKQSPVNVVISTGNHKQLPLYIENDIELVFTIYARC